jgi:ribA/ribD-fused uncharacterized protein
MIDLFRGDNFFLSNFYPCTITISKEIYPSVEHAYQALKSTDPKIRLSFQNPELTPGKAKRMGKDIVLRKDWELIKINIMHTLVLKKFKDKELARKLIDTFPEQLVEGNPWGDIFWGVSDGKGLNNLGKILMGVRDILMENK